jgi:ribosome-binding factor A
VKSKRQERVAQIVKTELSQIIHSGLIKGANAEYLDDELRTRISVVNTDVSPDLRQARISISIRPTPRSQQILSDDDDDDDDDDSIVLEDDNEDDDEDFTENDDEDEEFMDDDGEEDEDAGMIHNDYRIRNEPNDDDTTIMSSNDITNLQNAIQQRRASPAVDRRRAFAWLVRNTKPIRYTLAQRISHMKSCPDLTFVQVDVSAAVDVMYLIDKLSATDGKYKRDNIDLFNDDDVARGIVGGLDFDAIDDDDDDDDNSDDEDWDEAVDILVKTK